MRSSKQTLGGTPTALRGRVTQRRFRNGFTVMEVCLALVTLLFAAALLSQFLVASSQQRKLADQRRLAMEEISNRLERVLASKWDDVNARAIEKQEFTPEVQEILPAAKLTASVHDEPGPTGGKRVRLEISWEQKGQRVTPLGLTAWKYRAGEARQ